MNFFLMSKYTIPSPRAPGIEPIISTRRCLTDVAASVCVFVLRAFSLCKDILLEILTRDCVDSVFFFKYSLLFSGQYIGDVSVSSNVYFYERTRSASLFCAMIMHRLGRIATANNGGDLVRLKLFSAFSGHSC